MFFVSCELILYIECGLIMVFKGMSTGSFCLFLIKKLFHIWKSKYISDARRRSFSSSKVASLLQTPYKGRFTHSMPCPCRDHAVPLPCLAAKGLECVFPIWFTQCGHVWFTLAMQCPCHAPTMPWPLEERHGQSMAWAQHGKCESNGKDTF